MLLNANYLERKLCVCFKMPHSSMCQQIYKKNLKIWCFCLFKLSLGLVNEREKSSAACRVCVFSPEERLKECVCLQLAPPPFPSVGSSLRILARIITTHLKYLLHISVVLLLFLWPWYRHLKGRIWLPLWKITCITLLSFNPPQTWCDWSVELRLQILYMNTPLSVHGDYERDTISLRLLKHWN